MKRTNIFEREPHGYPFIGSFDVEILTEYFHKINAVEIEIDGIVESLNQSPSPLSKHRKILYRCDLAKELYSNFLNFTRSLESSISGNVVSFAKYSIFTIELLDMISDIQIIQSKSKEYIEEHKESQIARQRIREYSMPNVHQIATDVISKIDTANLGDKNITAQRAQEISRICREELIQSLYKAEGESVAVNNLNGMRTHYMDTLEENDALIGALRESSSQLENLSTMNEKQKQRITSLNKQLTAIKKKQTTQQTLLKKIEKRNAVLSRGNEKLSKSLELLQTENEALEHKQQELDETVHQQKKRRICSEESAETLVSQPHADERSRWTPGLFSWLFNQSSSQTHEKTEYFHDDGVRSNHS